MSARAGAGRSVLATVALACVATLLVAAGLWWLLLKPSANRYTAYFSSAVGLFAGSDVRVLGVKVGHIDEVTPMGTKVKVVLLVDKGTKIPSNAGAVSVAPSLVSDRYVQLAPVYDGGDELADGAEIPLERTINPLELDELYASLDRLTVALGPKGANKDGALSDFVHVQAQTLDGTGQTINDTIHQMSEAVRTLSGASGDLFTTVDNLQKFTTALATNDSQVRQFNDRLADVSHFLAGERADLGASLHELAIALDQVATFVHDNRATLKANVDKLSRITQMLVDQKADLQEFLDIVPLAISNLANAYNGFGGALETRMNLNELADPSLLLCRAVQPQVVAGGSVPGLPQGFVDACRNLAQQLGQTLGIPTPADTIAALQRGELPPIPILGASQPASAGQGGAPIPPGGTPGQAPVPPAPPGGGG